MADPKVRFKRSSVPGKIPNETQLPLGEIALNTYDGKVFASKNVGIGTTVFTVNPWNVGTGTDSYNINFTAGNVGVGSTLPTSKLDVTGNVKVSGIVTATSFSGSGTNLTGVITSIIAGAGITVTQSAGIVTVTSTSSSASVGLGSTGPASNYILTLTPAFDDVTSTFTIQYNGNPYYPVNEQQLIVSLGGVIQEPGVAYTTSGSNLYFASAPNVSTDYFIIGINAQTTGINKKSFSLTGVQTNFTLPGGYNLGYVDVYLNGARLVETLDFTATDGSTVGLTSAAQNGDVVDIIGFNGASLSLPSGDLEVFGNLSVTGITTLANVISTGIITASGFVGSLTGNASSATYATTAGIATYATSSGIATYATSAGIATYATSAGIATYAQVAGFSTSSGISTYATSAGIATYATAAGIATYATSAGVATYASSAGIATYADNSGISTYAASAGIATYAISSGISTYATTAGIATYATSSGIATYADNAGIATQATRLQNSRTFEITGDVIASAISFDGTGNVSLAATIQPNSVALGTDTTGDYVQSISGTANQITVTSGTGEGSTPVISIPNNPTLPGNVTITNDLQINNNLNVNGNITIGGTSAYIIADDFVVKDADIILGFTTNISGQDVSNDTTANHGGIAVASTEGYPLVNLTIAGIETTPTTYKKIMWFQAGSFAGLNTDAWLTNYAVGIGSTQFPDGTRFAAGNVQVTENDLVVVRNINASGVITASNFSGNASLNSLNVSGISTLGTVQISSGIVTATSGIVTYYGDGSKLSNVISGVGIQSSGTVIGYGLTTLNFIGAGNTFAINGTTIDISISSGAGGTWATYNAGIATNKSVGINTSTLDNSNLTGVGNSLQGLYISNGMIIVDNVLSGNHYIGTNFNGLMAGPVTITGTLTIDGNYVVV